MIKILLGSAFFLWSGFGAFAGFVPYGFSQPYYNPGPGYLQPSYSYQQGYGFNRRPGYPYILQKQRSNNGRSSSFACTRFSCGTLKGFKSCLMDEGGPYQYFSFKPQNVKDVRSITQLRKLIRLHPNCYSQFCNRVCSTVPVQFEKPKPVASVMEEEGINPENESFENDEGSEEDMESRDGDESVQAGDSRQGGSIGSNALPYKKPNWFARQRNRFKKNDAWRIHESHKRNVRYNRVEKLCQSKSMAGNEIKILCSECMPYLKDDREMIPACDVSLMYNGNLKMRTQRGFEEPRLMDMGESEPGKKMKSSAQQKEKVDQAKKEQKEKRKSERDQRKLEEEDMSETSSQSSRSSEGSQESSTSHSTQNSRLTSENLAQLPMGGPPPIAQWQQNVQNSQ